jgi:glycosyltransferase involved in cell wall biosynthesis
MLLLGPYRPDVRVEREARTLSEHGHKVSILAWNRIGNLPQHETCGRYEVVRLSPPLPRFFVELSSEGKAFAKAITSCIFYLKSIIAALRLNPSVVHAHDLDTMAPAVVLKWLTHAKLVFDSHEDYPAMLYEDLGRMGYWLGLSVQRLLLKAADVVVASNQAISGKFPSDMNSFVVENFVDLKWFDLVGQAPKNPRHTKPIAIYVGGMAARRGLEQILQAQPMIKSKVDLVLAGDGPLLNDLMELCEKQRVPVNFTGRIERWEDTIPQLIRSATVGLHLYQPTTNNVAGLPNKIFEYMAGGIPVIASDFPLIHEVICKHKCGLTVDPTSPRQIAQAVDYIVTHPAEAREFGTNGRRIVEKKYSWASSEHELLRAYALLGV